MLGFSKNDLVGHIPFEFHHHEDMDATLECSRGGEKPVDDVMLMTFFVNHLAVKCTPFWSLTEKESVGNCLRLSREC